MKETILASCACHNSFQPLLWVQQVAHHVTFMWLSGNERGTCMCTVLWQRDVWGVWGRCPNTWVSFRVEGQCATEGQDVASDQSPLGQTGASSECMDSRSRTCREHWEWSRSKVVCCEIISSWQWGYMHMKCHWPWHALIYSDAACLCVLFEHGKRDLEWVYLTQHCCNICMRY